MRFINGELQVPDWKMCPRCGSGSYETLRTHSHCVQCNFSPVADLEPEIPYWVFNRIKPTAISVVSRT